MKRLLISTDNFLPRMDGISRFLSEIIPYLKHKFDVVVVSPDFGDVFIEGVNHIKIPLSGKKYGDYMPAKWDYKKIESIVERSDIVFNQSHGPIGINALRAAKKLNKKVVTFTHSLEWELFPRAMKRKKGIIYFLTKLLMKKMYSYANILIVPAESIAEILDWHRIKTKKVVVRLGVDTTKFKKRDKRLVREELGISPSSIVIGYHGRIGYEKNLYTLVRAYKRIALKDKNLLIMGDGIEKIKKDITKIKGAIVIGTVYDVPKYLNAIDIYVMPSFTETTCLSLLEAMSCELPVITSRVGFIKEYVMDGVNGYFFDKSSSYDLYTKIKMLIEKREKWAVLGKNARDSVVKGFNWNETAKKVIEILESI